jgi:hypothetical protein
VGVTPFVRPNIRESRTLEPDHHFRQSLVRNSKHDGVSVDRSGRRLSRIEPQSELAEDLENRGGRFVPRGSVHHHDRVPQSRVSLQDFKMPFVPTPGTVPPHRRAG